MHLVLAGFKYNSPEEYTGMLNQIRDGLASDNKWLQRIAKQYPDAIGNDLYEEIFVYLCQMYIRDTYFTNGDLLSQFMNVLSENGDKDPLTFMNKIFNLIFSQTIEDRSNIGARAMNSMVTSFSKGAFTFGQSNPAEAVQMLQLRNKYNSQTAALKNRLEANGVKHDSDVGVNESYLVMKCKNQ